VALLPSKGYADNNNGLTSRMSTKNNFLVACGAGLATTLVAFSVLRRSLQQRSHLRKKDRIRENPGAQIDLQRALDNASQVEFGTGDKPNRGSKGPRVGAAVAVEHAVDWRPKPKWYRRFNAAKQGPQAVAAMAIVALTFAAVASHKQEQKLAAQLTQFGIIMMELQEHVRADQRPWIGLTEATVQPLGSDRGGFAIRLQNTGKTPAVGLHISAVVRIEDTGQAADLRNPGSFSSYYSAGTLMPGAGYPTDIWFKSSPNAMSGMARDQLRAVTFILVTYKDVFQAQHDTKICFYWQRSFTAVKPCDGYNEMN
jgi:hypothetical protein